MKKSAVLQHVAALVLVGAALTVAVVATAAPTVPNAISHQGRLYTAEGQPITDNLPMSFALYTVPEPQASDQPVWSEDHPSVPFTDGYYSVAMGSSNPLPDRLLRDNVATGLYLQISVNGEPLGPLAKLNSIPYALVCDDATGEIHPTSVSIGDTPVINANREWVGSPVVLSTTSWGQGANPTANMAFLSPPVTVTIDAGDEVVVTGQKAIGSTSPTGGLGLTLNICSQAMGGGITPVDMTGLNGIRVASGTRVVQTLSARISGLAADTYQFGLCGLSSNVASWNDNGLGLTTVVVEKKP